MWGSTMVLLCVNLSRTGRFWSLSASLTRNLQVSKQAAHLQKKPNTVFSQVSCHRKTNSVHIGAISTRPSLLLCSNGRRTECFQITSQTSTALRVAPIQTQWGHHFHTSAPVRALPAAYLWLVFKPLQKLVAIILGR